jgi:site-specific DNA-methyltransferase (adenine-specific)
MTHYKVYNEDCLNAATLITDNSVSLFICDPPFGLGESTFDKHYNRKKANVTQNYHEAPDNYEQWCFQWLSIAKQKLKPDGTMYIISGWNKLGEVLNAVQQAELHTINHIIWKYNFGVFTKCKFVSSHYHVLMLAKTSKPKFNTYCRFGPQEKNASGNKALYSDLEDVFTINKEYQQYKEGELKNTNKLPDALVEKLILYSSDKDDTVCDFFMGNFTTAYNALRLGRKAVGFEVNKEMFHYHEARLAAIEYGIGLRSLKAPEVQLPEKMGKRFEEGEKERIWKDFQDLTREGSMKLSQVYTTLQERYQRGKFSIKKVIDQLKVD